MKTLVLILLFFSMFLPRLSLAADGTESAYMEEKKTVSYALAYPGLLPDSPFYFLKVARDRAVGFLITEPLKKAEFNLLQADKRVYGGILLYEKDHTKLPLALTTIAKGQNYFEEAIAQVKKAKGKNMDISKLTLKMHDAAAKHEEVLVELQGQVKKEEKNTLSHHLKRVQNIQKEVERLSK